MNATLVEERPELVDEDPRIAERRRSVQTEHRRRRRRWLLTGLIGFTVVAGAWLITRTALFDVDQVHVQGTVHETEEQVVEASGLRPGDQLLDVDPTAVGRRVAALPWVDGVEVERGMDGVVTIVVSERTPVATVADTLGGVHLVDASGRLLGPAEGDTSGLLRLEGVTPGAPGDAVGGADGPLRVSAALSPGVRSRVTAIVVAADGSLQLRLKPEGIVQLGPPTDLAQKLASLATVMGQVDQRNLALIDLTNPSSPMFRRNP